jgi:ribosome-associated toxin RatA of RatAB toxin-antitoxin module
MYDIVNQVEAYPEFLPWCGGARLHQAKTRNSMVPGESIEITLVDGPFKQLHGQWQFTSIEQQGCKIELKLTFEFKRGLAAAVIAPAFTRIANTLVDSFCERARELYG